MNDAVENELDRIRKKAGGVLYPEDVVAAAKSTRSPLHSRFDWEDSVAGGKWRLHQARNLIRIYVTIIEADGPKTSRAYVSLSNDRNEGGGYRAIVDVLSNEDLREQMLADALEEMRLFKIKYASLVELAEVFAAMDSVRIRRRKK